jgi:hypothetical protein
MTVNKLPNQEDVLHRSGVAGIDINFINKIPDEVGVGTTGDARYNSNDYGIWIGGSTTAGDTARIQTLRVNSLNDFSKVISVFDLWVLESPIADDIEVGSIDQNGVNLDKGAYFDLATEEYHVGGVTKPATIPGSFTNTRLVIEEDIVNDETTFTQSTRSSGVNESVTISNTNFGNDRIVVYSSNENNDRSPAVARFKRVFIP